MYVKVVLIYEYNSYKEITFFFYKLNAVTPERRNGDLYLSKYFISSSGARTHNSHTLLPLRLKLRSSKKKSNN